MRKDFPKIPAILLFPLVATRHKGPAPGRKLAKGGHRARRTCYFAPCGPCVYDRRDRSIPELSLAFNPRGFDWRTDIAEPVRLKDYRVPDYLIDKVDLDVKLHPAAARVLARLAIPPEPARPPQCRARLDGDGLTPKTITLDGRASRFVRIGSVGWFCDAGPVHLEAAPPQRPFVLEIETEIDATANTRLMGLYRSGSVYCTQCEAEGFRRITYFLDRPRCAERLHRAAGGGIFRGADLALPTATRSPAAKSRERHAISRCGTIPIQSRVICSPWSARSWLDL